MYPIFAISWALAILFHMATPQGSRRSPLSVLLFAAATATLFFPTSGPLLLALAALQVAQFWERLPRSQTSEYLKFICGISMVATYAGLALAEGTLRPDTGAWLGSFAPLLRLTTSLLFFASVLHKLNRDFFAPETSHATIIMNPLVTALGLPSPPWLRASFPYVTILTEAFIAVGLLFPATRPPAVAVLLLFGFMVGVRGVVQFSWLLCALAFLFLEEEVFAGAISRIGSPAHVAFASGCLIFFAAALALRPPRGSYPVLLVVGASLVSALALFTVGRAVFTGSPTVWPGSMFPLSAGQVVLLVLFWLNELGPYVGYKDWPAFHMYSNLETGFRPNHLFLGRLFNSYFKRRDEVMLPPSTLKLFAQDPVEGCDFYLPYSSFAVMAPKIVSLGERGPIEYVRREARVSEDVDSLGRRERSWLDLVMPPRFFYHLPCARQRRQPASAPAPETSAYSPAPGPGAPEASSAARRTSSSSTSMSSRVVR